MRKHIPILLTLLLVPILPALARVTVNGIEYVAGLVSSGPISGTTGTFSGALSATTITASDNITTSAGAVRVLGGTPWSGPTIRDGDVEFNDGTGDSGAAIFSYAADKNMAIDATSAGLRWVENMGEAGAAVRAGVTLAGNYYTNIGSGSNAFAATVNGARFDFGDGSTDYASSDGTTVSFAGPTRTTTLDITTTSDAITFTPGGSGNTTAIAAMSTNQGLDFKGNRDAADAGYDIWLRPKATRVAGGIVGVTCAAGFSTCASIDYTGKGTFNGGTVIGSTGNVISKSLTGNTGAVDLASIANGACSAEQTIAITGATTTSACEGAGSATAGVLTTCYVSAADTVKLAVCNWSGGAHDPGSLTYYARVTVP